MNDEPLTSQLVLWNEVAGAEGEALRAQLRRLVAIVPSDKRARVLGQILGEKKLEGQTRDAVHSLLLAKTLTDMAGPLSLSRSCPKADPRLPIEKCGGEILRGGPPCYRQGGTDGQDWSVEVGPGRGSTRTPIRIVGFGWDGRTSFKGLKSYLLNQLRGAVRPEGPQSFSKGGFSISYEFIEHPLDREVPAVFSTSTTFHGGERDQVHEAINDKLSKYKLPLIVALDLAGVLSPFETVEEVLLGEVQLLLRVPTTAAELERIKSEPETSCYSILDVAERNPCQPFVADEVPLFFEPTFHLEFLNLIDRRVPRGYTLPIATSFILLVVCSAERVGVVGREDRGRDVARVWSLSFRYRAVVSGTEELATPPLGF